MKKNKKEKELIEKVAKMGKDLVVINRKSFVKLLEEELDIYEMFEDAKKLIDHLNKALEMSQKKINDLNNKLCDANKEIVRLNEVLEMEREIWS